MSEGSGPRPPGPGAVRRVHCAFFLARLSTSPPPPSRNLRHPRPRPHVSSCYGSLVRNPGASERLGGSTRCRVAMLRPVRFLDSVIYPLLLLKRGDGQLSLAAYLVLFNGVFGQIIQVLSLAVHASPVPAAPTPEGQDHHLTAPSPRFPSRGSPSPPLLFPFAAGRRPACPQREHPDLRSAGPPVDGAKNRALASPSGQL